MTDTLRRLMHLWLSILVNFSVIPLRLSTFAGFALSIVGFAHVQQQFFPLSERPELFLQLRLPEGSASNRACKPFCKFFRMSGTRLTYVILYFGNASRTNSGRSVRR